MAEQNAETGPDKSGRGLTCLVIGPIGDKFADPGSERREIYEDALRVLEEAIVPACAEFGIDPIRSDQIAQPGEIPEQIFELLRDADIVIADLSGGNPNVMYELGLRHSRNACTVCLSAHQDEIPFDVRVIRTIIFRRTELGLIDARNDLVASVRECVQGNYRPVTATRILNGAATTHQPAEPAEATLTVPDDADAAGEEGFLERMAAMEEALPKLLTLLEDLTAEMLGIQELFVGAQERIEQLEAKGTNSAAARLSVARGVGGELGTRAERLEELAERYEFELTRADGGMSYMIGAVEETPSRLHELGELPQTVEVTVGQMREAMSGADQLADLIASLASVAKPLRQPAKRVAAALRRVSKASAIFQVWNTRLQGLLLTTTESGSASKTLE